MPASSLRPDPRLPTSVPGRVCAGIMCSVIALICGALSCFLLLAHPQNMGPAVCCIVAGGVFSAFFVLALLLVLWAVTKAVWIANFIERAVTKLHIALAVFLLYVVAYLAWVALSL